MFKLQKQNNKQAKSGERVDFRFSNFQANQVPKAWDRLSLSVICVETGKTVAKLGKAIVKNGNCQWPETLLESLWISQDDSSQELEESLYKFVVSMGSARSGILGEGTINLASYAGSRMSAPVLLPLTKCNYGTTLQVKIHCLTPRSKFREEAKSVGSDMKEQDLDHNVASKSNDSDDLVSAASHGFPSTRDVGSNSGPSKFEIKERSYSESGSNNSFSSAESFTRPSKNHIKSEGSNDIGKQVRASHDPKNDYFFDDHSVSNQSSYNTKATGSREDMQNNGKDFTPSSLTNYSSSSRNLLEAAEDTIEELRIEAKMWERNARKLMLDLDLLRQEFSDQSKKQADLVMDLSAAYSEQGSLKKEIENLKLILEESKEKHMVSSEDSIFWSNGPNHIQEELEDEIRHQQELNASLALQLKGSQDSNLELVSLLQELEETTEQQKVEIENLSSLHLRLPDLKISQEKSHELEALTEKVQELERDCAELTQENLDLLIKFKESNETEKSNIEDPENVGGGNSENFVELVKQLEVAFHHLKRPWHKLSSSVSDQCRLHLDNLPNLTENGASSTLSYLFELNHLLKTRIVECEELLKQNEEEIQERNTSVAESQRKLEDYGVEVQAHERSKAELQVQYSTLLNELDKKASELQTNEEEQNSLLETIRLMTVEKESRESELDESRSITMNLQEEIGKLENEMNTNIADLKGKLDDMQSMWSQAREECGHLTEENQKLQGSLENVLEESKTLQQSNSELERKNVELHEHCVHLEAQLHESQKSLSNNLTKVKALEENLNSMWKDFSLKEERLNTELTVLIQENKNETEKLVQQESLSNRRYSEKLTEVESLKKEVEQLTKQISDAFHEVSCLRADKSRLESTLGEVQSKTEKELGQVRIESDLKIRDFMSELAASRQSYEKLMLDHERVSKLLPSYRANEEKLKTSINDLELQLTLSRYEHQKLHEESANLKFQLQRTKELQDEVSDLKNELNECTSKKETLEASLKIISGDYEEMKKVLAELENSNKRRIYLEEKVKQMENDLTEKEKLCAQVADLKKDFSETKIKNEQYQQKIYKMEEDKENCLRKVQALEAEVKMMEEEKKIYAKKFEQNDTPKSTSKHTTFSRAPQKLSQSQELPVDRLHSEGENGFSDKSSRSVEVDLLARIQLLENKLAEALEANKKYKIQIQRFKTEERKGHSPAKRLDGDSELVKRFEHTKAVLETELKDLRERYFQMSLKYAEVEAQREDLVMKLKAAKSGKRWFS